MQTRWIVLIVACIMMTFYCQQVELEEMNYVDVIQYCSLDTVKISSDLSPLTITDIASTSNYLIILDCPNARLKIISDDGNQYSQFGRTGAGPGEMYWPLSICALSDSTILVSDYTGLHSFDVDGTWNGCNALEGQSNPMMELTVMNCSTFTAYKHDIYLHDNRTLLDWTVATYSANGQRNTVFLTDTLGIDRMDATQILHGSLFAYHFTSGGNRFFYSDRNSSEYRIICVDASNKHLYDIVKDFPVCIKTEVEMERERESVESWLCGCGGSNVMDYTYNPREWRETIRCMWVTDDSNELWVQRGDIEGYFFDIYSTIDGTQIRTAEAVIDTIGLWGVSFFVSDSNSIYAVLEDYNANHLLIELSHVE